MEENPVGVKVVLIGGSAGSLEVLLQVLSGITLIPFALIIVMHRRSGDDTMLEDLLSSRSIIPVDDTFDKNYIAPGRIYVAPADYHLLFEKDGRLSLDLSDRVNYSRPSIDVTFDAAAEAFGGDVAALLLSGANTDGTAGLIAVKNAGGITAVQDPGDASMPFMPGHAKLHARPDKVLKISQIQEWLLSL